MTEGRECLRQTARDVRETADLRVGGSLGGRKNDLHQPPDVNEM